MAAVLGVSVTLNVGLFMRSTELATLRLDLVSEMRKARAHHDALHQDVAQLVALKHPELVGTLPRTIHHV